MDIDYSKFDPGVALSDKITLERCPECGASCHAFSKKDSHGNVTTRYVHSVKIERVASKTAKDGKPRLRNNEHNRFELSSPERPPRYRSKVVPQQFCVPGDRARREASAVP